MMKVTTKILLVLALLITAGLTDSLAQPSGSAPPGGPSGGTTPPCWPPPCIPVDGGISVLIALGAAFGGKKAYDHFKNNEEVAD